MKRRDFLRALLIAPLTATVSVALRFVPSPANRERVAPRFEPAAEHAVGSLYYDTQACTLFVFGGRGRWEHVHSA
jgi:hypothetical protein